MTLLNSDTTAGTAPAGRWRTVDIVVASVVAVAFGVVSFSWGFVWAALEPAFLAFPPGRAVVYGVWIVPGVLGALVVRRRGAAVFTSLVAACVSTALGATWGLAVVVYGLAQGLLPELVFAARRYRSWSAATAVLAGAAGGVAAVVLDLYVFRYYPEFSAGYQLAFAGLVVLSAALVAGLGSWLLVRALARTGVLAPFASGREQRQL